MSLISDTIVVDFSDAAITTICSRVTFTITAIVMRVFWLLEDTSANIGQNWLFRWKSRAFSKANASHKWCLFWLKHLYDFAVRIVILNIEQSRTAISWTPRRCLICGDQSGLTYHLRRSDVSTFSCFGMSSTHNAERDGDIFFVGSKVNKDELLVTTDDTTISACIVFRGRVISNQTFATDMTVSSLDGNPTYFTIHLTLHSLISSSFVTSQNKCHHWSSWVNRCFSNSVFRLKIFGQEYSVTVVVFTWSV
jgi:hypothetical protein